MFGMQALDIALGLIFVYLLLSLICTAANELIAGLFKLRARNLAQAVNNLLRDTKGPHLGDKFFAHPLIKSLYKGRSRPSYIEPPTFVLALLDLVAPGSIGTAKPVAKVKQHVKKLSANSEIRKTLQLLIDDSENNIDKLRSDLEGWFNNSMKRAAGWYKRKTQFIVLILAVVITGVLNADSTQIAKALTNDPALREALVAQAQEFAKRETLGADTMADKVRTTGQPAAAKASPAERIGQNIDQLQQLGVPLGWKKWPQDMAEWINKVIGLLLTALAVSLGAPFWFDLLQKVVNIRAAGGSPVVSAKPRES